MGDFVDCFFQLVVVYYCVVVGMVQEFGQFVFDIVGQWYVCLFVFGQVVEFYSGIGDWVVVFVYDYCDQCMIVQCYVDLVVYYVVYCVDQYCVVQIQLFCVDLIDDVWCVVGQVQYCVVGGDG